VVVRGEDSRAPADEPLSPELVLVCPELRQRALELEAARKVVVEPPRAVGQAPPSRSRLRLVVSVSTLALSLAGASVSVGRPSTSVPLAPPAPVVAAIALRDATALGPRVSVRAGKELASFVQPSPSRRVEPRVHTKPELGPQLLPPRIPHPQVDLAAAESELEPVSNLLGPLPDPTPRPLRLSPGTARTILAGARLRRVDWALLAAELRATASDWPHPSAWRIRFVANRLARHRDAADLEPLVIAQYDRAVGIDSLISGLEGARSVLASQVLRDPRISIYRDGQRDVSAGRVDVRVLALLLFLARRTGEVTVSSLVTGHSEPLGGGRSSHDFGAAVEQIGRAHV